MVTRKPLPADLQNLPFTHSTARKAGVTRGRLRAKDLDRLSRLIYVPADADLTLTQRLRVHMEVSPGAWASHRTAAALHELAVPPWLTDHSRLHLSRPHGTQRVRRLGVVGHRVRYTDSELCTVDGVFVTTPARTWLDLAMELPHEHLVALGDQIIRKPRPEFDGGRAEPFATRLSLMAMLDAHPKMKGVGRCRLALEDMRVGADSVPETLLRLALVYAGLPEPDLQIRLFPDSPRSPSGDMGYTDLRIVIQYEGAHHAAEEQRLSDARRDRAFRNAGWIVIHVTLEDLREDFRGVIRRIRAAYAERQAA